MANATLAEVIKEMPKPRVLLRRESRVASFLGTQVLVVENDVEK